MRAHRPQDARQLTRSHGLLAHGASARGPAWLARASSSHEAKSLQGFHAARLAVSSHACEARRGGGGTGEVAASYRRPAPSRTRLSHSPCTAGAQPMAQMLALSSAGASAARARLCCHARCHASHPTPHAPQPPPRPLHARRKARRSPLRREPGRSGRCPPMSPSHATPSAPPRTCRSLSRHSSPCSPCACGTRRHRRA